MKYSHVVKYKGVWYPAGADVPVGTPEPKRVEIPVVEPEEEAVEETTYSRTAIQQMRKAELLELAEKEGIETNEDTTASWLKTELLKHFGL